jgi:hypothetical protein
VGGWAPLRVGASCPGPGVGCHWQWPGGGPGCRWVGASGRVGGRAVAQVRHEARAAKLGCLRVDGSPTGMVNAGAGRRPSGLLLAAAPPSPGRRGPGRAGPWACMPGCPLTFRWRPELSLGIWGCPIPCDQSSNDTTAANGNRASGPRMHHDAEPRTMLRQAAGLLSRPRHQGYTY